MKLLKKYRSFVLTMCFLLIGQLAYSHVTRIRVKQNQDGTLTWRVETYHSLGQCGVANSGIQINGVNYALQSEGSMNESDRYILPNDGFSLFANATSTALYGSQIALRSYGQVITPYIPGNLNVNPYSSNVCWAFSVGGNQSFTPPPPPVCTTPPVTSVSNTLGAPNNNNTDCIVTDDSIPVTLNISHLACGNITGDGELSVFYSDGTLIGNVAYQNGISTPYAFNLPQGKLAQLTIVDDDFPNNPFNYSVTGLNGTSFTGATNITPITPVLADVNGQCNVSVPLATTTDNCGSTINGTTSDPLSYSVQGQYIITWTFDAGNGNSTTATQNVTVNDTVFPTITSPFDITTNVDANECGAHVTYAIPTASDNCGTGAPPTSLPNHTYKGDLNGHTYFLSEVKVTPEVAHANAIAAGGHLATISDAAENSFISGFIADFIWIGATDRDVEGQWKWITNEPMNYTNWSGGEPNDWGPGEDWAVINWGGVNNPSWNDWYYTQPAYYAIEFDGGTLPTTLVSGPASGDFFPVGTTTVTYAAFDPSGNSAETSFDVTVIDNIAPNTPTLADVTGQCGATASVPTTTDNCAGTINGTTSDSLTYATQGTHVITWSFDDGNGNIIMANQNVIVNDTTDPNTPTLADVTGQCDATASVPTTTDNCSGTINGTTSDPLTYAAQGTHVITWSFDDGNGNAITANQNVIVNDTIAPIAVAQDFTITLDEFGSATITADDIDNGSSDNCTYTPSIDITTFDCTNIGIQNTVTLTVTDASGNTDFTTANVTILEHFKETLDLRSLSSFEAFTGTGAVTNSGNFTGNVGTNVGALTGFTGPNFNGSIHFNDALTAQAGLDLLKVYIHLNNIPVTHPSANNAAHAPAFGSGETLTPGVYDIGGAGSVAGTLTLNGQGDPNAVFIMKFKGAFTAGAASNIVLTNGADAANVFWVAQGALSVGANSIIKGTLLAYPGAITLGVNSSIEGRLLSSVGAITVGVGGTATMPGTMNLPINPMISYSPAAAVDVLGSIENFSLFTSNGAVANASTSGILGDVGADVGAITGFATSAHIGSFYNADAVTAQAKIDLNNAYSQLMLIPTTVSNHTPAFGSGETLQAGVYSTPGAGSLAGTITLDGQNNPDAIFIFKFNGAFAAGALSKVILSNGTRRCNVFWISEGAASIGAFSMIKGTVLAHGGAATMGAGGNLEGRLLSTGGAIGFSTGVVYTVVHDVECDTYTVPKIAVKEVVDTAITSFEEELQVYPNPSKGVFNIKLSTVNIHTEIYLFDTAGKLIARESISKENNSGNLIRIGSNNLSSGIYLVKIITKDKAVTKKVIVEKSN